MNYFEFCEFIEFNFYFQVLQLPLIIENARSTLNSSLSSKHIPLYSWNEIKMMMGFIENEDLLKTVIHSLHVIGVIVEIKWSEYEGDVLVEKVFVIGNPKWLSDLLRTIVTVSGGGVKNGLISRKQLIGLWSQLKCDVEPLIQLMNQLDIMVRLGDGEEFLIPCMLPDSISQNGSEFVCSNSHWIFRRSYLMCEGKAIPIGVIGKMIAVSMRWGQVKSVWKEGCVVMKDDVWYSVRRQRVKQNNGNGTMSVVDGIHILMSSMIGNDSTFCQKSFRHFRQCLSNVLCEFYHIKHIEVIPIDDECSDWCCVDDVMKSIHEKVCWVTSQNGEKKRVDALCCDLRVEEFVMKISSSDIKLYEILGRGAFGTVQRGEVICHNRREKEKEKESENESEREILEVAVKVLEKKDEEKKESEGNLQNEKESEKDENVDIKDIVSTNWEMYLMSSIDHVNVVKLIGVCVEEKTPWIVMELMKGGDLYTSLTDPSKLKNPLGKFVKSFQIEYNKVVLGNSSLTMREAVGNEIENVQKCVDKVVASSSFGVSHIPNDISSSSSSSISGNSQHPLVKLFEKLLECGQNYWDTKTKESYEMFSQSQDEVKMDDFFI